MFSPGKWHESVPKDYLANLEFRADLLAQARTDPKLQRAMIVACEQDLLFYINAFVVQFNPKKKGLDAVGPFISYPYQDLALVARPQTHDGKRGILWCYENNKSAVIEKSREMGATWLFLIVQDWLAMFHPYFQSLNISRSADLVDSKSPDSLFWKLRFIHQHLPGWLKGPLTEERMCITYHRTKSVVAGEASTGRAGVGGRASVIFVDEFSKIREATEVRQRTANTADCRFFNSTHGGQETEFYKLTQTPEFVKIQMHWMDHPEKNRGAYRWNKERNKIELLDKDKKFKYPRPFNFVRTEAPIGGPHPGVRSPWYDWKCSEIGDTRGISIELDINVAGSVLQFFEATVIRSLRDEVCRSPLWQGEIVYDQDAGKALSLRYQPGGPLLLWRVPKSDTEMPAGKYGGGVDCSEGKGVTNSVLSIGDALTGEKVLEIAHANMGPDKFAALCTALCWLFKDASGEPCLLSWETPGPGVQFGKRVLELGYRNVYFRETVSIDGPKAGTIPGFHSNAETKAELLREYRTALEARLFLNPSDMALQECAPYRYAANGTVVHPHDVKVDDPTKARANHGDRVIADALAWRMMKRLGAGRPEVRREEEEQVIHPGSLAGRLRMWQDGLRRRA